MLNGLCVGEEAGARNLVFFRVKWLQPAMRGTSCVRRLRLGSFLSRMCSSSLVDGFGLQHLQVTCNLVVRKLSKLSFYLILR